MALWELNIWRLLWKLLKNYVFFVWSKIFWVCLNDRKCGLFINYYVISIGTIPLKLFARYNIKGSYILVIAHKFSASCIQITYLHTDLLGTWCHYPKFSKFRSIGQKLLLYSDHNFGYIRLRTAKSKCIGKLFISCFRWYAVWPSYWSNIV